MEKAYILMGCVLGKEKEAVSALKSVDNVVEVHGTLGTYDIFAEIAAETEEEISRIVTDKVRKMNLITSTMTLIRVEGGEYFARKDDNLEEPAPEEGGVRAYVVLHVDKGAEFAVIRNLDKIPGVSGADAILGFYDIICKVRLPNRQELERTITRRIRRLESIQTSMTLHVIEEQE